MLMWGKLSFMKSTYLFILFISCTSCLKYQYATISSSFKKENSTEFLIENDTLRLTYDFSGEDGPVKILVYNKLSTPIYINWSKSALIMGDRRISYWSKNLIINATVNNLESGVARYIIASNGTVNGTITYDENLSFIPPKSSVTENQVTLRNQFFKIPSSSKPSRKVVNNVSLKTSHYTRENSPLIFRSFLTLSVTENFESPIYFDDTFWVSEIIQTIASPEQHIRRNDQFYISKATGAGVFVGVIALAGLTLLEVSGD